MRTASSVARHGAFSGKVGTGFPQKMRPTNKGAFSGKVGTDLGFTRDRHSILPKSAEADLGGFPKRTCANQMNLERIPP